MKAILKIIQIEIQITLPLFILSTVYKLAFSILETCIWLPEWLQRKGAFCTATTLPRQWSLITISQDNHSFHPMFPTDHCRLVFYIPLECEMVLPARIYAYNRHLSFDVAFICSTLTHCGVCHLSVWRLKWEVSYVHHSVWRWKWFFYQSNYVLQQLMLCRMSDTVFQREIDSRRQWGYGTCYGGIVSPLRRSVHCYILVIMCILVYLVTNKSL